MFHHVVMFRFVEGTTAEQVAAVTAGLAGLPAAIPQIRSYVFGPDAGLNPGTYDYAVSAAFDSADDYVVYRDHPEHRAFIARCIAPVVADRAACQFSDHGRG